jgi:phosphoribosylformylglycinamidine synthase
VAVPPEQEERFAALCAERGLAHARLGVTEGTGPEAVLAVQDAFTLPLAEIRQVWSATLPAALG